jgi:tRNA uridine 5-carboxymethylaminomethyl modification enzyme
MPASRRLRQPGVTLQSLVDRREVSISVGAFDAELDIVSAETTVKYEGYLERQRRAVERGRKLESTRIPGGFPYEGVPGLSRELVQRFTQTRPETLGQALRIPGATPASVAVLGAYIRRQSRPLHDVMPAADAGQAGERG